MNLVYRKRVSGDLTDVYEWYERQQQGLGEELLADFDALIATIVEFPQSFTRIDDKVRRATMARFPYHVFYKIEIKRIIVLAVVHSARHPSTWPESRKRSH